MQGNPVYRLSRDEQRRRESSRRTKQNLFFFLLLPLSYLFFELVMKAGLFGGFSFRGFWYALLFSCALGFLTELITLCFSVKVNRIITTVILSFSTVHFMSQFVYFKFFKDFYRIQMLTLAGQVGGFMDGTMKAIGDSLFAIILMLIPLAVFLIFRKKYSPTFAPTSALRIALAAAVIVCHGIALITVYSHGGDYDDRYYYKESFSISEAIKRFGLVTATRLDLQNEISPFSEDVSGGGDIANPFDTTAVETDTTAPEEVIDIPKEYGYNEMDIDFESLIANETDATIKEMHEYFSSLTPSHKNEYTGMFKGKNLIFLTLEGFSNRFIDKDLTPTLYKMANEGFVFNNFYTSLWGGSTATGEYAAVSGNFYNTAKCLEMSTPNYLPFCMGNQFSKIGYLTLAFHDHFHTYYGRDGSHPNMGYNFIAIGSGLEDLKSEEFPDGMNDHWPRSDYELADVSLQTFIDKEPFHVYYMTVSGHANYTFYGNYMAKKNADAVASLPYSENVRAYIASQMEVEYMLTRLVSALDEKGILENTVFCMSADHYPYALADSELSELYGIPEAGIHDNIDLLKNGLLLWCASMKEPVIVDTPCSAIDIVPTLSNLFGLEYDSRLLAGNDVFSDVEPLAIINLDGGGPAWNWRNKYGSYNTGTKTFTPAEGFSASETEIDDYVKQMNKVVAAKRKYSFLVLEKDYYRHVFGK